MSNSLENDLEQLYLDGYKKGRADERERCVQDIELMRNIFLEETDLAAKEQAFVNAGIDESIKAIKAE